MKRRLGSGFPPLLAFSHLFLPLQAPVPGGGAGRPPAPPPGSSNVPLPPRGGATMPVAVEQESYEQVDDFGFGLPPPSSLAAGGRQPAPLPGGGQSRAPAPLPPPPIGDDSFGFGAPVVMEQDAYNSLPPPRSDANVPVAQNMPQYTNVDEEQDTIGFGVVETSGMLEWGEVDAVCT